LQNHAVDAADDGEAVDTDAEEEPHANAEQGDTDAEVSHCFGLGVEPLFRK
jgi:hypothetical protein